MAKLLRIALTIGRRRGRVWLSRGVVYHEPAGEVVLPNTPPRSVCAPGRLGQVLREELDRLVMRALVKDRNRRYESASAFAADVQRYLNDEAVAACPPSAGYRDRKSVV